MAEPGEEDNLGFDEGDLIEIVEKSADGWWTGRVDGNVGVFPASFVEIIQIPKTKEERKRLLKRFEQGRLGETASLGKSFTINNNTPAVSVRTVASCSCPFQ